MIEAKFPLMTDGELRSLRDNVARLSESGNDRQRLEAERLRPLVNSELQTRSESALAAKPPRPAPVKRKRAAKRDEETAA